MQAFRTQIIKINSASLRNTCRRLSINAGSRPSSAKPVESSVIPETGEAATPSPPQSSAEEAAATTVANAAVLESATTAAINVASRYNVVAERTFGGFTKPLSIAELNHKVNDQQHLQPCKMSAFCAGRDKNQAIQFPRSIETNNASAFAESKTRANLTLPLKPVKLASPFPEPVKVMMSHTTSDEEKAQRMLAESKSQKMSDRTPTTGFGSRSYSTLNINGVVMKPTTISRYYTTTTRPLFGEDDSMDQGGKCKKLKAGEKTKSCPRYSLDNCPKRARESCEDRAKDVVCTKQESPYPAYSEFCHEDVIEKPTECKMCPWSTEKHPSFKPPKRKLHITRTLTMSRRTGLERLDDRIKAAKAETAEFVEAARKEAMGEAPAGDVTRSAGDLSKILDDDGMQCDLRKPECQRPQRRPCGEKKKEKPKKKKKENKQPKKDCADVAKAEEDPSSAESSSLDGIFTDKRGTIDAGLVEPAAMEAAKKKSDGSGKGKCTKLPFLPYDSPKRTPREPRTVGGCPKKPKKPLVIDCPPDEEVKCAGNDAALGSGAIDPAPLTGPPKLFKMEYILKKKKEDKKCPKVDLNMARPEEEDEDPCKIRKENTKQCPTDLLPIRRRVKRPPPKKKADSIASLPVDLPSEATHQQPKI